MTTSNAASGIYEGRFDEARLKDWARGIRSQLGSSKPSLGIIFMTPAFFEDAAQALEVVRLHAQVPLLVGCSTVSLIADSEEREDTEGLALGLYHLPDATLHPTRFTQAEVEAFENTSAWHAHTGVAPDQSRGWLAFANPFHLDAEAWLHQWNESYPAIPTVGGLASGDFTHQRTQVYLNGDVFEDGGVAVATGGRVRIDGVVSQGCTPIGDSWTITQTDRNIIRRIGNRPAYEVLVDTFNSLPNNEQDKTRGNLLVGLVVNEYLEDFHRGDFLIRNLLGADPKTGSILVGTWPRTGQTIQFQRRDAEAANEDMTQLLAHARKRFQGSTLLGGCLCCCNGRGQHLFGRSGHDAALVQRTLGLPALTGFFCSGEIGPIGQRNFLHGFTASLAVFLGDPSVS